MIILLVAHCLRAQLCSMSTGRRQGKSQARAAQLAVSVFMPSNGDARVAIRPSQSFSRAVLGLLLSGLVQSVQVLDLPRTQPLFLSHLISN